MRGAPRPWRLDRGGKGGLRHRLKSGIDATKTSLDGGAGAS